MAYRPMQTKSGYLFGEVVSALQKCIRRGLEKEAMFWALELDDGYSQYLWRRLVIIVAEDIGMANAPLVAAILQMQGAVEAYRKRYEYYDMALLGFAIIAMARSPKSREADEIFHEVARERRLGQRLEVPEFAKDMHTAAGREAGKNIIDFWNDGALVSPEAYKSRYIPFNKDGCSGADGKGRLVKGHESRVDMEDRMGRPNQGQMVLFGPMTQVPDDEAPASESLEPPADD